MRKARFVTVVVCGELIGKVSLHRHGHPTGNAEFVIHSLIHTIGVPRAALTPRSS
jgi:hypothetical protein